MRFRLTFIDSKFRNLRKEECPSCKMTLFGYKQDIYKHIHFNYENCIMENENSMYYLSYLMVVINYTSACSCTIILIN